MALDLRDRPKTPSMRGSSLDVRRPRRHDVELWIEEPEEHSALRGISGSAHIGWPEMLADVVRLFVTHYVRLDSAAIALLRDVTRLEQKVAHASYAALHDLGPEWVLEHPLHVTIESFDDHVIARIPELSAYGDGVTEQEAIADLRQNVIEGRAGLEGLEPGSELAESWLRLVRPARRPATP